MSWTKEQQKVIDLRQRNILVSAAAGSGKTAVLVERIIKRILDEQNPVDVDRLLVVTFTKAAAAEMRERIGDALERALQAEPENLHLQKQQSLLHNAQITTIDSFCLFVVRNYFHKIALEPGFRIADEGELNLLKEDVLDRVMESFYEMEDEEIRSFFEIFSTAKSDGRVREMVMELYLVAESNPWQEEWLDSLQKGYEVTEENLDEAPWMKAINAYYRNSMEGILEELRTALALTKDSDGPNMYQPAIESDMELVEKLAQQNTYDGIQESLLHTGSYAKLAPARKYEGSIEKQEQVKEIRNRMKDTVKEFATKFYVQPETELLQSVRRLQPILRALIRLTKAFGKAYGEEKRKKNLVDFSDIEHFALDILVDGESKEPTDTAGEFQEYFEEIMIDEYQDSNYVQETILTAVSRQWRGENNLFMVGDVKQSIYRFRLARPELFMEKYESYTAQDSPKQKIELHKNFRSRREVLDTVNDIFYKIMAKDMGRIAYNEDVALYVGAEFETAGQENGTETYVIESRQEEEEEQKENPVLEAAVIAKKILEYKDSFQIKDKESGKMRRAGYSDMVILLRSPGSYAEEMVKELGRWGIPAHAASKSGYFSTQEILILLNYLSVLDNPMQDIPLASVLSSYFVGLSQEELAQIRILNPKTPFHETVLELIKKLESEEKVANLERETIQKLQKAYAFYKEFREKSTYLPIHELLQEVLTKTGYLNYVSALPAGEQRRANVEILMERAIAYESSSYRGLFHFIRYIEKLQKYDVDFGEAEMISENEEAVRIMSIHKSKGLEFPICFVAGLGKQFNKSDSRGALVIHPDLGVGFDDYDRKRRTKTPVFLKNVLAKQLELENLGEELRVLYVALTRAKEKLVLVGCVKNSGEKLIAYKNRAAKDILPFGIRKGAACYFDWILPALFSYGEKYPVYLEKGDTAAAELAQEIEQGFRKEELLAGIQKADTAQIEELKEMLSYRYPMEEDISLKTKISVSELKHRNMVFGEEEKDTIQWYEPEIPVPYVPNFVEKRTEENQGALRGTAVHRAMECMDFSEMERRIEERGIAREDKDGLRTLVCERLKELLQENKIDEEMHGLILPEKIAGFFTKNISKRMAQAAERKELFLEKPFVLGKPAKEIDSGKQSGELVLIQGIVDVFFIENGKIVVLDYKTDRVNKKEQLIGRYKTQLELYAEALAKVFEVEIGEKLIYSFALEDTIEV